MVEDDDPSAWTEPVPFSPRIMRHLAPKPGQTTSGEAGFYSEKPLECSGNPKILLYPNPNTQAISETFWRFPGAPPTPRIEGCFLKTICETGFENKKVFQIKGPIRYVFRDFISVEERPRMRYGFNTFNCNSLRLHLYLIFSLTLPLCAINSMACFAADPPSQNLVLIVDASNRMAETIDGTMKIDIVKEALTGLMETLPEGVNTRFIEQYKHQAAEHKDPGELSPLAHKQAIIAGIRSFSLKDDKQAALTGGKIQDAPGIFPDGCTVVWVSAGDRGVRLDPSPLIGKLRKSGGNFSYHMIGLGLSDKGKKELARFAKTAGGTLYLAGNAKELGAVMKEAVGALERSAGTLKIRASEDGAPIKAGYVISISGSGPDEPRKVTEGGMDSGTTVINLAPGKYDLTVTDLEVAGGADATFPGVTLEPGQTVERVAQFSTGALEVEVFRNGQPFRAFCDVYKAEDASNKESFSVFERWIEPGGASFKLVPGVYNVYIRDLHDSDRPMMDFQAIRIEDGKSTRQSAEFLAGTLRITAVAQKASGTSVPPRCLIHRAGQNPLVDIPATRGELPGGTGSFYLSAGNYIVTLIPPNGPPLVLPEIHIDPGATVEKTVELPKISD